MIEESKFCSEVIKEHFNKDFENSTKRWIYDDTYLDSNANLKLNGHITGKCRGSAYKDFNISVKVNHKILVVFHNLKKYDLHLIL